MKFCAPVIVSIVSTRFCTPDSFSVAAGGGGLAVEIHQAADRRAVDVGDRRQVDEDLALPGGDQAADRGREVAERSDTSARVSPTRTIDDVAGLFGGEIHQYAPVVAAVRAARL